MLIRPEEPADESAIHEVTERAFAARSHTGHMEAAIIRTLRADGDLTLSLVAAVDGLVVGHIAFSPVAIDGHHGSWFGLGPLAVRPVAQRRGVGSALVEAGLGELRRQRATVCVVLGDPDFYGRFGFESSGTLHYGGVPSRFIQRIVFEGEAPSGTLGYARAFDLAAGSCRA